MRHQLHYRNIKQAENLNPLSLKEMLHLLFHFILDDLNCLIYVYSVRAVGAEAAMRD
jgi:hypothetical protein